MRLNKPSVSTLFRATSLVIQFGFLGVSGLTQTAPERLKQTYFGNHKSGQVVIPPLKGVDLKDAESQLKSDFHLVVGNITRLDGEGAKGTIASTNPPEGTPVNLGSTVNLFIWSGDLPHASVDQSTTPDREGRPEKKIMTIRILDLGGRDLASAMATLERDLHLRVGEILYQQGPGSAGKVARTIPQAGTLVDSGTKVDLILWSEDSRLLKIALVVSGGLIGGYGLSRLLRRRPPKQPGPPLRPSVLISLRGDSLAPCMEHPGGESPVLGLSLRLTLDSTSILKPSLTQVSIRLEKP